MHDDELVPVGEHFTFLLEKDRVYNVSRPYPTAWCAKAQATKTVWYRMDGGIPAENRGFEVKPGEPMNYHDIDGEWKIVTKFANCWFQAQWLGINALPK